MDVTPNRTRCSAKSGSVRGRLAAQRRGDARASWQARMIRSMASSTAASDSSNSSAHVSESRSTPSIELGEVVGPDRHAVDPEGGVLGQPVHDGGHLCHHPAQQPPLAAERTRRRRPRGKPRAPIAYARTGSSGGGSASPHERGRAARARGRRGRARGRIGSSRGTRSSGCPRAVRNGRRPSGHGTRWCGSRWSGR